VFPLSVLELGRTARVDAQRLRDGRRWSGLECRDVALKCDERRQCGKEDGIIEPARRRRDTQDGRAGKVTRRGLESKNDDRQQGVFYSALREEARR